MTRRPSIAAALIVKNEEENLPRLIASIVDVVDKIYITDTGSTDRTVDVAMALGCEVSHFKWCDDFSAARNFNFSQVKEDFTLWLDADDVLENKQDFINFRNDAMGLADFWLAPYIYASDHNNNPTCSFVRERVVRTDKHFKWKYPIHEGMTPDSGVQPVRCQMIPTWHVRHKRTDIDLAKDRSRNLDILEKMTNRDSRLEYYYGKELFEMGQPFDAAKVLEQVICRKDLELHDRILAIQYCCFALMSCNQFEKALSIAYTGIAIAPQRAELYCVVADCYLKMGRMQDSIPAFNAAKNCFKTPDNAANPIFQNKDSYEIYPNNQLFKVKSNLGQFIEALEEAKAFDQKCPNPETKEIISEIKKYLAKDKGYSSAKKCDDIVISCPPTGAYEWDGDLYKTRSMGGSETAAIEMAINLRNISRRKVRIFNMRQTAKTCDGIEYLPASSTVDYFSENEPYLHIAWRHNIKLTNAPTFVWSHDLQTPGVENTSAYDKVMCLTPFHKRYMMATQGIPEDKIWVTRNGINPTRFKDGPWRKDPNKVIFPSSPDRGLDRAMRIMDKVREKHPDAYLAVYYGIEHLPKYGQTDLMHKLKAMMDERPWVKYYGAVHQDELVKHFKEAAIWLYPSDWIETSCITASEVLCSGVYPIARRVGGVVDTLSYAESEGMASILDTECVTELEHQKFVDEVCHVLETKAWERVKIDPYTLSWERVAKSWLEELPKLGSAN